jgi:Uma2 family endonuclease
MNAPFPIPPITPQPHRFTLDDVERMQEIGLLDEGGKFELIEGEIIDMPSEGELHLELKERLNRYLVSALPRIYGVVPDGTLRLSDHNAPEPDFYVYSKPGKAFDQRGPDVLLVIEIAVSSLQDNLGRKARIYREHGVREYWVVDADSGETHIHRLDGEWPAIPAIPFSGVLKAHLIPNLEIRIAELLAD